MFFKKTDKTPDPAHEQAKFKNFICTSFGYTDETVQNLYLAFWPELLATRPVVEYVEALTRLSSTEYFYKVGRKQAAYAAFCLMLADALVDKSHPGFVLKANNHRSILLAATYYRLISKNVDGYVWLCQNDTVSHDAWLYIKSGRGHFAAVITGDVLHVDDQAEDDVSQFDLSAIGGLGGSSDVPPIFDIAAAAGNDQDVLASLSSGASESAEDIGKQNNKQPTFDDFLP